MKLRPCGDRAVLVEVDDTDAVLGLYAALNNPVPAGITELVPADRTLLVRFDPTVIDGTALRCLIRRTPPTTVKTPCERRVVVPVIYDGPDLTEVGDRTGLGEDGVIAAHTAGDYIVVFAGFTPGFGYMTGLDEVLQLPRRRVPRIRVPRGAVAIADRYTGVYPRASPGGWQLLGRTELAVWHEDRDPPTLFAPGTRVAFHAVSG
ncbi:5-oxoprolinase subunit B family protein [Mycolicibacterium goodii]|uniref:5-oxoprolinase subunit B family protein n=1 Tax=Mycolicibacterium goodii TaxID=134601 RepID=UPI000C26873C|nr:allophanate hydrolase subunit 1 [Mycolicibacterium goodii]PJK20431.1 allophanate hydrolase [Mycolicibacterium goodii]